MRVLVAHGSKMGGTEEIARWIGSTLGEQGFEVDVLPAGEVTDVTPYDGIVVGGALYAFRWHKEARQFVKHLAHQLRAKPVWFFSSGPLDDSANNRNIPPTWGVRKLMERIGAVDHATFGGRMLPNDSSSLPVGDWRDRERVSIWAKQIAADLAERSAGR